MTSCYRSSVDTNALSSSNSNANHIEYRLAFIYQQIKSTICFIRYLLQGFTVKDYEVFKMNDPYFLPSTSWLKKFLFVCLFSLFFSISIETCLSVYELAVFPVN